ncbi:hypothetical protein [Jeotgalibacillus sp. JSM ZJ347]|uniref:hypothetical protein n=1 Tax=Jeotgalibacillus sp. JSM ZJ347 TaxID=3342117 RepID=UPI0035A927AC
MTKYWAMKTYKEWANEFQNNSEIGIDEQNVDNEFTTYDKTQLTSILDNPRLVRRFDQFCKWMKKGDYVIIGVGQTTQFNMQLIGRIISDYEFDNSRKLYRHFRRIEILKSFDQPIKVEKWGQVQRVELLDSNDFIETLVISL